MTSNFAIFISVVCISAVIIFLIFHYAQNNALLPSRSIFPFVVSYILFSLCWLGAEFLSQRGVNFFAISPLALIVSTTPVVVGMYLFYTFFMVRKGKDNNDDRPLANDQLIQDAAKSILQSNDFLFSLSNAVPAATIDPQDGTATLPGILA